MDPLENIIPMATNEYSLSDIVEFINDTQTHPHILTHSATSPLLTLPQTQQLPQIIPQSKPKQKPYIRIEEQPGKGVRYRYKCEGRLAGSIPGANSTPENKTFPTIVIENYEGPLIVIVSCVTVDHPYRQHPHNLVHKEFCEKGVYRRKLNGDNLRIVFSNLGIQCATKKSFTQELEIRESQRIDPFKTKFEHKKQPSSIDLNVVRLCFEAYYAVDNSWKPMSPVVSDPIQNNKNGTNLTICSMCSCSASVIGGNEIILLCEKLGKAEIQIRFYELDSDETVIWESIVQVNPSDIHKQSAIKFKTPRYHNTEVSQKTKVFLQLVRPSDNSVSEPYSFEYYPDPDHHKRKRLKSGGGAIMNNLRSELALKGHLTNTQFQCDIPSTHNANAFAFSPLGQEVKNEPATSPRDYGSYQNCLTPSPQTQTNMNQNFIPSPSTMTSHSPLTVQTAMFGCYGIQQTTSPTQNIVISPDTFTQTNDNFNGGNNFKNFLDTAPRSSGGSITHIGDAGNNLKDDFKMNIVDNVPQTLQSQPISQQFENDNMMTNMAAVEGPTLSESTLSGLIKSLANEQLFNADLGELQNLSNISISS